jgi:hypothetical protein
LITLLIVLLIVALLTGGYGGGRGWGWYGWSPLGILLLVVLLLWLLSPGALFAQGLDNSVIHKPPENATNLELWTWIAGIVLPPIASTIIQAGWSRSLQSVTVVGLALAAGTITCYFSGTLNGADLATTIAKVFAAAITSYLGFWKPTGIAPRIEAATTIDRQARNMAHLRLSTQL